MTGAAPLLEARDLSVTFATPRGQVHALDGVELSVHRGETVGLVGESGSGKSTLALTLLRAIEPTGGEILFDGQAIGHLGSRALKPVRRRLQMVFQDPYASLDPRMKVGRIVAEPLRAHAYGDRARIAARVAELLEQVGLPADAAGRYPAQFSGGQRQRIAIARAIALEPDMVVADEPVSALDVSIQAQIVNLLQDIQDRLGIAYLVIAHDLPLVHQIADRIVVLYLGRVVEEGPAEQVVARPLHPYTAGLLAATPTVDTAGRPRLMLKGDPPSPINRPDGCPFHPRCPIARDRCRSERPALVAPDAGAARRVACHFPGEVPPPLAAGA
ncbi:MAG: ATP-binding cassette domain-containing protein [Rhodobacteraceae bacterium]|nr:ATP-binding cassette domain-containing protein [Paracoccaceae bacterium]